jgi:eukaryotic-like serine/threonine-protein kinase
MKQLIGKVINNFEIQEVIGQGGMGIVLRAYHPDLQRYAAVKIMRPELANQPGFFERFLQEARATAQLDHPGIVDVINFGRYENSFYLMMDFVEGPTLRQLINENPGGCRCGMWLRFSFRLARRWLSPTSGAFCTGI